MRRLVPYVCGAAAAASVMVASQEARADIIPISVAARIGYEKFSDDKAGDFGYLPIQLDAMYNLGYGLHIGAYGSYAPAVSKPDGIDSSTLTRVGIQAHFKLSLPIIHPWVGAGTGYNHLSFKTKEVAGFSAEASDGGWEQFNLQAGVQFALLPILELGPYVQFERGKFGDSDAQSRWNGGLRAEVSF